MNDLTTLISRAWRTERQPLPEWKRRAMQRWVTDTRATLARLHSKGDIVVKFTANKEDRREVVMYRVSDIPRLERFLAETLETLDDET